MARYGVELKRHGADLIGLCPFHEDHEPSLVVTPAKNLWHCLGACQAGGSVIDWVMKAEGVCFRHAVEILRQDAAAGAAVSGARRATVRRLPTAAPSRDADDEELLGAGDRLLPRDAQGEPGGARVPREPRPPAPRGDRALPARLRQPDARLPAAGEEPQGRRRDPEPAPEARRPCARAATSTSTARSSSRSSTSAGEVLEVYGRKITPTTLRPGTPLHLYLPGPHRGVFNVEALAVSEEIILCEALIDALTFWCAGFRNVTASYGVEGFTDDHLEAFKRYGTERVLIAYDRDEAGDRAAESARARSSWREGIECFRIQFPKGMDANEYALKVQPAERSLGLVLRQAVWMGKGAARERPLRAGRRGRAGSVRPKARSRLRRRAATGRGRDDPRARRRADGRDHRARGRDA